MKLYAFTDIHADLAQLARIKKTIQKEGVALAVCTGDFTVFGRGMKEMLAGMNDLGVPLVLIHGNHEDEDEVQALLPKHKNILFAHGTIVEAKGLRFFGFGGHGFRRREPELEALEKAFGSKIDGSTIVLCHAPPYGTAADDMEDEWHVGNESLTDLIKRRKPMLVLCGHIHETFHAHDEVAGTVVINPGPDGEIIEVEE
jgi:Icc-related predicted phosphoesterase